MLIIRFCHNDKIYDLPVTLGMVSQLFGSIKSNQVDLIYIEDDVEYCFNLTG